MDIYIISILKSVTWLGVFAIATYLGVPKCIYFWNLWKKTNKSIHLSNAVGYAVLTLFLYSLDLMVMLESIRGWTR